VNNFIIGREAALCGEPSAVNKTSFAPLQFAAWGGGSLPTFSESRYGRFAAYNEIPRRPYRLARNNNLIFFGLCGHAQKAARAA
jgi:hypothetical protein